MPQIFEPPLTLAKWASVCISPRPVRHDVERRRSSAREAASELSCKATWAHPTFPDEPTTACTSTTSQLPRSAFKFARFRQTPLIIEHNRRHQNRRLNHWTSARRRLGVAAARGQGPGTGVLAAGKLHRALSEKVLAGNGTRRCPVEKDLTKFLKSTLPIMKIRHFALLSLLLIFPVLCPGDVPLRQIH